MADREKVIHGLKCIAGELALPDCQNCKYNDLTVNFDHCVKVIAADALELLKPVKPIRMNHKQNCQMDNYRCGVCYEDMYYEQPFCETCGTEAKWDD